tara:strand:+ start:109 stop:273 length:165 start_codon:yes stop_codon:yes gene_type:complete
MSSSICPPCGKRQAAESKSKSYNSKKSFLQNKHDSFEDAQTVEELKDWIREYML